MQRSLLFFCLLISVGCTTTTPSVQRDPFDRTRPADCVPLPPTPTLDLRPRTPTPNLATQMANRLSRTQTAITVAPFPTPHFIDLSPEIPDKDKMVARVYRCDGTWDEYLLDSVIFPDAIPLSHGDIIYDAYPPASLMGHEPPEPITPTIFQINNITAETALPTPIPEQILTTPMPNALQDDYEIYTTILPEVFVSSPVFVIDQNTFTKAGELTLPNGELHALLSETLSDFISQNRQSYPLKTIFSRDEKRFILADRADFYEKPSAENGLSCTWMRVECFNASKFKAAYPEASGIILLSKIGYGSDRTQALVTIEQDNGQDSGVIYILLLQKESGQWKIEDTYELFWVI